MNIDKSYERKIDTAEREIGDKLFFLLWFATLIQLGLVVWEWINLVPAFHRLIGFPDANEIKAIELSTAAYLIIQLAYMGKKEITRWVRRTESVLQPDEYIRRIRIGDNAVLIWGVLYLASVLCVALHVIERMPAELSRTFIQVATLYTCAFVSKAAFKGRFKQAKAANHADPVSADSPKAGIAIDSTSEKEKELLEFMKEKKAVNIRDCIGQTKIPKSTINRLLGNLLGSGLIVREGNGRGAAYSVKEKGD